MTTSSENELNRLVALAKEGDRESLEQVAIVVRNHVRRIAERSAPRAFRSRFTGSTLAQQVMFAVFVAPNLFRGSFRGTTFGELIKWLERVVESRATDLIRMHSRKRRSLSRELNCGVTNVAAISDEAPVENSLVNEEAVQQVRVALEALSDTQRSVVELRVDEGLKFTEIGERLGISERMARHHYKRATEVLRATIPS